MNELAGNAERAAENGRTGELYQIVKTLTGEKRRTTAAVNDTNGRLTNEKRERTKIWKEHFDTVLKKEPPVRPIQPHEMETRHNYREFGTGAFQQADVKNPIKSTRSGKADGHDNVGCRTFKNRLKERAK